MIGFALLCIAAGSLLAAVAFLAFNQLAQFKERTIDDVPEFLRPPKEEVDRSLFDPAVDDALRQLRVPETLRRKQRIRLDLAAERYRCKYHAVRVVLQWLNTEWHDMRHLHTMGEYTQEALENLQIARELGSRFCRLALLPMAKMWMLRILLRLDKFLLLPTPNIAAFRKVGRVDMLKLYEEFKLAAAEFARTYGDDQSEQLRALL